MGENNLEALTYSEPNCYYGIVLFEDSLIF